MKRIIWKSLLLWAIGINVVAIPVLWIPELREKGMGWGSIISLALNFLVTGYWLGAWNERGVEVKKGTP